jgi:NAD(P)-dependent dehydrogenase (short-subunit alcohol dehydrogenase family)
MDLGLRDRVALVTGASGGIGGAIARALAGEGARVAIGYHSSRDAAGRLAEEIGALGGRAMTVEHDLAEPATITAGVDDVVGRWGRLDVLVTSAWVHPDWPNQQGPVTDPAPIEMWRQQLRANVEGTVATVNAAMPHLRTNGWGRIVLISSGAAEDGSPGREAYAGAKAALHGLGRSLSRGVAGAGILTNVVMPGFVPTERNRRMVPAPVLERFASMTPTGRLATEDEVARVVTFLASEANGSVNGVAVRVSGGLVH